MVAETGRGQNDGGEAHDQIATWNTNGSSMHMVMNHAELRKTNARTRRYLYRRYIVRYIYVFHQANQGSQSYPGTSQYHYDQFGACQPEKY